MTMIGGDESWLADGQSLVVAPCGMRMAVPLSVTADIYLSVDSPLVFCTETIDNLIDTEVLCPSS